MLSVLISTQPVTQEAPFTRFAPMGINKMATSPNVGPTNLTVNL